LIAAAARARPVSRVVGLWLSPSTASWARRAIAASGCLLVLDSAGTLHFGYTLTLSYLLIIIGCLLGAPELARRWGVQPALLRALAVSLFVVYVLAAIAGDPTTLATSQRAGAQREFVYLFDLALGLTTLVLVPALWHRTSAAVLARALAVAGALAGAYGVYQWLALRYGLPFADINNTLDSNGVTTGASQGIGLFGGARIRGTFLEPHFLGAFLAAVLPLQAWSTVHYERRMRALSGVGFALSLLALLLTDSAAAWGTLALATASAALLVVVGRGEIRAAAAIGVAVAALWMAIVPTLAAPGVLASLTGRPSAELNYTTSYRTAIWKRDVKVWEARPVLGYGPGQSAVQVAYAYTAPAKPQTLVSAQGVWASALIDAGVVGLCGWLYLVGTVLVTGSRGVIRRPTLLAGAAFAAALAVVVDVATSGDRLDPRHWLLLGLLLAASRSQSSSEAGEGQQQAG